MYTDLKTQNRPRLQCSGRRGHSAAWPTRSRCMLDPGWREYFAMAPGSSGSCGGQNRDLSWPHEPYFITCIVDVFVYSALATCRNQRLSWWSTITVFEVLLYVHRNRRFIRDGSPGRPHRLSRSSWALKLLVECNHGQYSVSLVTAGHETESEVGICIFQTRVRSRDPQWPGLSISGSLIMTPVISVPSLDFDMMTRHELPHEYSKEWSITFRLKHNVRHV